MIASAFLSGHFSRGALLSVRMVSVGEMETVPAGILPLTEIMKICRLICMDPDLPFCLRRPLASTGPQHPFRWTGWWGTIPSWVRRCPDVQRYFVLGVWASTVFEGERDGAGEPHRDTDFFEEDANFNQMELALVVAHSKIFFTKIYI